MAHILILGGGAAQNKDVCHAKKKVLLARSLCEPSHLLVWDEPLNYVDVLSRIQLEELLLEFQPTIVFVEHDRVFCDRVATKAVTL